LCNVFHVNIAFHDPSLHSLGLHNSIVAVGHQFIEVVAPITDNTTAERYRQRRGGDTGYMLIFQTDNHEKHMQIVGDQQVRIVGQFSAPGFRNMQLHPVDTGGTFIEIDQQDGEDMWHPAGRVWKETVDTTFVTAISGADVACNDPEEVSQLWSQLLDTPVSIGSNCGRHKLRLGTETIRFVPTNSHIEGIDAVEILTTHREEIVARAQARALPHSESHVVIGGVSFLLKDVP
jgi:hypothetical protein